jgi:hypothetical protein
VNPEVSLDYGPSLAATDLWGIGKMAQYLVQGAKVHRDCAEIEVRVDQVSVFDAEKSGWGSSHWAGCLSEWTHHGITAFR